MIKIENLQKTYKIAKKDKGLRGALKSLFVHKYEYKNAVDGISFEIGEGEIVGYIGANGAGKSTTIKMMCGILLPTSGEITVNGLNPYKRRMENARNIGVVFGQRSQLEWDIPVRESFNLIGKIYGLSKERYNESLAYLTEVLDLEPLLKIPVRQLSLGQKMRCELGAAFLHNPKIVYLDEPTIGLDVDVKARIREFIKTVNKKYNTTIILTTHDMQDIEEICERIVIIDKGKLVYDGTIARLKKEYFGTKEITFELDVSLPDKVLPYEAMNKTTIIKINDNNFTVSYNIDDYTSTNVIQYYMSRSAVKEIVIAEPGIETIVKKIYSEGYSNHGNAGDAATGEIKLPD